jgi:hypothetical protein
MHRVAVVAPALVALGVARLVPADGSFGLWLRLVAATAVLLVPGRLVALALGQPTASAALGWSCAAIAGALAVTFAVHSSLTLTLVLVAVVALVALPFARRDREPSVGRGLVLLAGVALGIALWHVAGVIHGDAFQHLGRVRKLDDFGSLSLRAVDEFRDGGLHPGYAFPLWHAFLALVAKLGGVDPGAAVLHEPSALGPVALLVAYEAGTAIFRSAWLGGAFVLASTTLYGLAGGGGGAYSTLELPGTTARQLLLPALLTAFFACLREPGWPVAATVAALSLSLAFVHVTYGLFLLLVLAAFLVARCGFVRRVEGVLAFAAAAVPAALVVAWLVPIVRETASHNPSRVEKLRAIAHYRSDLDVTSLTRYHLRPEAFSRAGAVALAALLLLPLAALAARRRWSPFVLGSAVLLLALELSSRLFPHFSDVVSLSQSRRAAGFVPFAAAFAGGMAVASRTLRFVVLPAALLAGIALQEKYPGDFGHGLHGGGPAWAAWFALAAGAVALVVALVLASRRPLERDDWLPFAAAALFVLPVAVDGFRDWHPKVAHDGYALTPGLVRALQQIPEREVVFADLETSYRISAALPLYVANAPPAHVADTRANRPCARRREWLLFRRTGDLAIPRAYGATWLVLTRDEQPVVHLQPVYRDARFALDRVPPGSRATLPRVQEACTVTG